MISIKPESSEWERMWNWVADHPINKGLSEPSVAMSKDNKTWRYVDSFRNKNETVHQFIHENHPITNKAESICLISREVISDDEIQRSVQVK